MFTDQYNGATVSLRVVDAEGDEVLSLDARTAIIVDPDILPFKAQLEELTFRDGNFHLSMLTCDLCLDNIIITCRRQTLQLEQFRLSGKSFCFLFP